MKNKKLLGAIIATSIVAIAIGFYLNLPKIPLISPLFEATKAPDLTDKLSQKLSHSPPLDYSDSSSPEVPENISYLVYNTSNNKVYAAKNTLAKISPASFTKLMTSIVALDVSSPNQLISTSKDSINREPTVLGLKEGEQLTVIELIRSSIVTSANDAAATLAEGVALTYGQKPKFFITLMNQKARLMNMDNTQFANPEGYDDHNQYSNLEDIAKLVYNVQQNYPDILKAGMEDRKDLEATSTHGFYYLPNWNGLLGVYPGVNGLKIAYTEKAGYSTIVTATRQDISITAILTGAKTLKERDQIAAQLLDLAFQKEGLSPINLSPETIQKRYDIWNDLARQIRAELATQSATQE